MLFLLNLVLSDDDWCCEFYVGIVGDSLLFSGQLTVLLVSSVYVHLYRLMDADGVSFSNAWQPYSVSGQYGSFQAI